MRPWIIRLQERKFLIPILTILLIIINDILDLGIDQETYWRLVALALGYAGIEGYVDGKKCKEVK